MVKNYKKDIIDDDFKAKYRKYWAMNSAGLTGEHFDTYFKMLKDGKCNFVTILTKLYKIRTRKNLNTLQLSFATKLIHTINNDEPIYDKNIALVLWGQGGFNDSKFAFECQLNSRLQKYEELKSRYRDLLEDEYIKNLIDEFRREIKDNLILSEECELITNTRMLDYLIYSYGKFIF